MAQPDAASVRRAVVEAYASATGLSADAVSTGFDGDPAVPFDSILGLELMVAMEGRFGIEIPEDEETTAANFKNLAAFARMAEKYVRMPRS